MKLKKLIIQGFKSFKDRTIISFDEGITGIVGPNGCGKSNIVDALFWVMGEQSAKHLRGNSMKDLIFSGSSKYNQATWAEASLILENDDGKHIHIGNKVSSPSEIQLTRKLYRNGETEYRINGLPSRLKDIQEVFMDTGAGAKSYSIIAQGEINKLVQSKPEDRRTIIEEVAGITKFKVRKKESLKKIDQTQSNLSRLEDLQLEIEKNLKSLEKQAERAEKARSLKDKIKKAELVVNSHKVFDCLRDHREKKASYTEKQLEVENWLTRKNILEVDLEEERFKKDEQTAKLEDLNVEYNDMSKVLAASEERLNNLKKNLEDKESLLESREKEALDQKEEIVEREQKLSDLKIKREELEKNRDEGLDFSDLEEKVDNLRDDLELKQLVSSDLIDEIKNEKEKVEKYDKELFRNSSKLEEYANNLEDITQEIESLEGQYSEVSGEISEEREAVISAEQSADELVKRESELKTNIVQLELSYKESSNVTKNRSRDLIKTESKLSSLKELKDSLEGAKEGATKFLGTENGQNCSVFGAVIQCEDKFTNAVQRALSEYLDYVVSSDDTLEDLFSWVNENGDLAIDLLSTISGGNGFADISDILRSNESLGNIWKLSDIVTFDIEFSDKLSKVLDGIYLAEKLSENDFNKIDDLINYRAIISLDGNLLIKKVGDIKSLSVKGDGDDSQGIIARNNKIAELEEQLIILQNEFENSENQLSAKLDELELQKAKLDDIRVQASEASANFQVKRSALELKLSNFETNNSRLQILKNRKAEISKSRLDILEKEETLLKEKDLLDISFEDKNIRFEELKDELDNFKAVYDEEKENLVQKQINSKSFEARYEGIISQIEDIQLQIEKSKSRIVSSENLIEQYENESNMLSDEIDALTDSNHNKAAELSDKEDIVSLLRDDFAQLLIGMQKREDEAKKLGRDINKNEKIFVELEIKLGQYIAEEEQLVRNIFEKYQIDLRKSVGTFLNYIENEYNEFNDLSGMFFIETEKGLKEIIPESYEFLRKYGQDLKDAGNRLKQYKQEFSRLGEINWQAIEDYERQKLRFDFLKDQEVELKKSLENLENAIAHIDEKSKQRFKVAFDEVNSRFEKVFPIIFGGGQAELKITGDINDAECGVDIIAKPPGKKMQNINLMSGGEKAMTAVSLIFSIFLVKPSPFCLLDEVDAPLDDANVGRFNELLREMSQESQFILITHNKKTMEMNDTLYGVTMQEPGVSSAVSVQLH